jgi:hypothetical protein
VLPSRWTISLQRSSSLSRLWMTSWCKWLSPLSNGCTSRVLGLKILQVQGKGGRTGYLSGLGRPAWAPSARFDRPFAPVGPHVIMHFSPSTCMILTMSSSRPRWRFSSHEVRSFTLQSPGVFLVALRSLPPLEVISSSS